MKACKGCTNSDCEAYTKKIRYKENDIFCVKCGSHLRYVCADCWKRMEHNDKKYCISCKAKREQKNAQNGEKVKRGVQGVATVVAGIVAIVGAGAKLINKK